MPQLVICHECSAILHESIELKHTDEVIQSYNGKCPTCGKKLAYIPKNFEVKLVNKTNQLSPAGPEKKRPSRKKSWKKQKTLKEKGIRKLRTEIKEHMEEEPNKRKKKEESIE